MTTLEKAISQKHLTKDTVDAQFCSDWLKQEIHRLFDEREMLRIALFQNGNCPLICGECREAAEKALLATDSN